MEKFWKATVPKSPKDVNAVKDYYIRPVSENAHDAIPSGPKVGAYFILLLFFEVI